MPAAAEAPDAALDGEGRRLEAIAQLPDGGELRALAGMTASASQPAQPQPAEQRAAQARFAQLVDSGVVNLEGFSGEALGELAVHGSTSRLRQLAAEAILEPAQLRELSKLVRTKDKNVYRILTQKLDALNAQERAAAAIIDEINSICTALERHSHRVFDPLYVGVFEHHYHRWLKLTTLPDADQSRRAGEGIARCQAVIMGHAQQVAREAEQQAAQLAAREAQRLAQQAAETEAAAKAEIDARLQQETAAARAADEAVRAERHAAEEHRLRQIGGLLRKANAELTAGHSQSAAGLRRAIEEKLAAASPVVPGHLAKGLQQLDARLDELKEWKSFAVAPKRVELIRDMEALIGSTEEPKVLAERIKALQEDWKTISKGIVSDGSEDWERFHKASQTAYQPCREYFEAQSKLRQENLKRRQSVLDRVRAVEANSNVEAPDWRLLANVLREAPLEWRSHSPVERDAARPLQADFDASLSRLHAKLDAWHERNVADKQTLIQRAKLLLNLDDGREATETVKRLQAQWKDIGPASREREQSLWHEFREQCDAVFQKRQQAHVDYTARLEAVKTQVLALCAEVEQAAGVAGSELLEANGKIFAWRAAFEALGELPRAEARGLQRRFDQAIGSLEAQAAQQRTRDAQKSITDIFEAARKVRACEWAAIQGASDLERESLRRQAEEFIGALNKKGPTGTNQAIKEALAKTDTVTGADLEARERALRILCIRCEILSEKSTPIEDESLRREFQVQRLMQGLGQGALSNDWNAMLVEWIRINAVAPELHDSLQSRFMSRWLENAAGAARTAPPPRQQRHESRPRS